MQLKQFFMPIALKPAREPDDGPRYADLYERGASAAIDLTLMFFLLHDLFSYLTAYFIGLANNDELIAAREAGNNMEGMTHLFMSGLPQFWAINFVLQLGIMGLLVLGCQFTWRTTPGKYLLGLSIRRAGTFEQPAYWRYVLRFLAYIPGGLSFFWISFNKQHRGIHDYIAGTVVIHTRPHGWYWGQVKRGFFWLKDRLRPPVE